MLKTKSYEYLLDRELGYEENMLDSLFDEWDEGYFDDIIHEIADNYVEIYTDPLWDLAPKIKWWIEESIDQGLIDISNRLESVFMAGQYSYNNELLYENLDTLKFNYIVDEIFELDEDFLINNNLDYEIEDFIKDDDLESMEGFRESVKEFISDLMEGVE